MAASPPGNPKGAAHTWIPSRRSGLRDIRGRFQKKHLEERFIKPAWVLSSVCRGWSSERPLWKQAKLENPSMAEECCLLFIRVFI
ncbi:hypothetical protein SRHO_G00041680 [Serrasalmus rhombeus]